MKSQTSTEYLIIVAIVIIIAVLVIGILGGIPAIGGENSARVDQIVLQSEDIGLANIVARTTGHSFALINNQAEKVSVVDMWVNGTRCTLYPKNIVLDIGQQKNVVCYGVRHFTTEPVVVPYNITYQSMKTGANFSLHDLSITLEPLWGIQMRTGDNSCWSYGGYGMDEVNCQTTQGMGDGVQDGTSKELATIATNKYYDSLTNLFWYVNTTTGYNRDDATSYCSNLDDGTHDDWRLPNVIELLTLADFENNTFVGPSTMTVDSNYWTSTNSSGSSSIALILFYGTGYVRESNIATSSTTTFGVVCTRGAVNPVLTDGFDGEKSYAVYNDNITIDLNTGLVWDRYRSLGTSGSWNSSWEYCQNHTLGGFTDWRMPNAIEAATLYDWSCNATNAGCVGNRMNAQVGYTAVSTNTATRGEDSQYSFSFNTKDKDYPGTVKCVRGNIK